MGLIEGNDVGVAADVSLDGEDHELPGGGRRTRVVRPDPRGPRGRVDVDDTVLLPRRVDR